MKVPLLRMEEYGSDERTMALIEQVGNDIHPSIQREIDYPSKHQGGKLPILDLKVWVESREKKTERQVGKVSVIMYEFHSKCMASKAVINARSALSWSTKRTVLTQEVLRVLMNCFQLFVVLMELVSMVTFICCLILLFSKTDPPKTAPVRW